MWRWVWKEHRIATLVFGTAVAVAVIFAVRLVAFWIFWANPAHRKMAPEGWMTPGYVAMSWDVPREVVGEALGLEAGKRRALEDIAAERGVHLSDLIADLQAALDSYRAGRE
jgi:hypothetical protein